MDKLNIVIAGCGWLGRQIGQSLSHKGHHVYGSYRSERSKNEIDKCAIHSFHIDKLNPSILENTDVLIITIPPDRGGAIDSYATTLVKIATPFPEKTKVIFTSSTGIYPKKDERYSEDYPFDGTEQNNQLYQGEKALKDLLDERITILRLGGLIGPDRHPVRSLSGRTLPTNGHAPVNLIDSRDVVRLIQFLIEKNIFGEVLNVCFPILLTKKDYYEMIAERLGIEWPNYAGNTDVIRLIDTSALIQKHHFKFEYPITDYSSGR